MNTKGTLVLEPPALVSGRVARHSAQDVRFRTLVVQLLSLHCPLQCRQTCCVCLILGAAWPARVFDPAAVLGALICNASPSSHPAKCASNVAALWRCQAAR